MTSSSPFVNGVESNLLDSHSTQLFASGMPKHFWENVFRKLDDQIYDAGNYFQICRLSYADGDYEEGDSLWQVVVTHSNGIKKDDPNCIFLIDHAWTYKANEAASSLSEHPGLLERMAALMDIPSDGSNDGISEKVLKEMWKYNCTYSLSSHIPEENEPIWYIMDEFGSRIQHDGDPNFRMVPFYYTKDACCYSLLFPIKDVDEGEEITRNYVESTPTSDVYRDAEMIPWFPVDLSHLDQRQEEDPESFSMCEELPSTPAVGISPLPEKRIKVFTDYEFVEVYLTNNCFEIVQSEEEAHIIWISFHFKDYRRLSTQPEKRINQFPGEYILTSKNLLAVVARRGGAQDEVGGDSEPDDTFYPEWYLPTFCLKKELHLFVSKFQQRSKRNMDNHWIVKPWNLGRGIDITVSDNLTRIVRLSSTGPKIAQKYIENPVLFHRKDISKKVKFDLRFIVILLSVSPLKIGIYDRFWIRFANKSFDLEDLEDYEKHFTVNNYNDSFLLQMFCHDFIAEFDSQYGPNAWSKVQGRINKMVKEVFVRATKLPHPWGIPHSSQSKGCYGFDVMLDWKHSESGGREIQPKLLEINFGSDCKRACEYYPEFFNDLFSVMFLDETGHNITIIE